MHSPLASPRATIDVLKAHGLFAKKSLGQHFLVDDNVVGRILDLADLSGDEVVLEVGPGIGTLSAALVDAADRVVAVERDRRLLPVLADTVGTNAFRVVSADALAVEPADISAPFGPPKAFIANLPYGIAATLVLRFFEILPSLDFAVVMVQAEVANRMCAQPGSKDFGSYTVKLRLLAEPAGRFAVPPACFLPPPRVDSAVLRLQRRVPAQDPDTVAAASRIADAAFSQRRKTLRNSLRAGLDDADAAQALLTSADIDGSRRAETLGVQEYEILGRKALELGLLP